VASREDPLKSARGTVHLYGFLIEVVGNQRTNCQVTCISQMGTGHAVQ